MKRSAANLGSRVPRKRLLRPASGLLLVVAAVGSTTLAEPGCQSSSGTTPTVMPSATPATPTPLDCASGDAGDWPMFGGNVCNTRAGQTSDPITALTVSRLAMKWKFAASGDISATPAVVGGQVYVGDWGGMFYRLDAATGQVVWSRAVADILSPSPDGGAGSSVEAGLSDGAASDGESADSATVDGEAPDAATADGGPAGADAAGPDAGTPPETEDAAGTEDAGSIRSTMGAVIRNTPVITGGLVIAGVATVKPSTNNSWPTMVALDQSSGAVVWRTQLDPNPFAIITSSPVLDDGRLYVGVSSNEETGPITVSGYACCTFRGSVAALDPMTGKVLWQTPMIEDAAYRNGDGTLSGFSGAAVWSSPTLDRKRKLLYVSTGNNYSATAAVTDAGAPLPNGDHVESIVALDLDTGAIRWSQRMTKGDIWNFGNYAGNDWDFGGSPNLFRIAVDAGFHDVIGAGQKS